jgi:hypothetical protein
MQLGEEELMKLIQQGLQTEINSRERDHLFPIDYLREGWSAMDIFFVQVTTPPSPLLPSDDSCLSLAVTSPSWSPDNLHWSL